MNKLDERLLASLPAGTVVLAGDKNGSSLHGAFGGDLIDVGITLGHLQRTLDQAKAIARKKAVEQFGPPGGLVFDKAVEVTLGSDLVRMREVVREVGGATHEPHGTAAT